MLCKCSGKYIDIYFNLKITCCKPFWIGLDRGKGGVGGEAPHLRRGDWEAEPPSLGLTNVCDNFSYVCCCICWRPSINYQTIKSPFVPTEYLPAE